MHNEIKILICSDIDYEQLIAEVYIGGKFVALISQDEGASNLKVIFPDCDQNETAIARKVDYSTLHVALEKARRELVEQWNLKQIVGDKLEE